MSIINLNIPSLGNDFVDLRDLIPGDSYNWSWVRSLSQVNYLAIHHSGGPDTQTPIEIANYHINNNGWGGIGYHFLIGKDGMVYYVGDISTARANVANLNEQVIGICLVGNFTEGRTPTQEQYDSAYKLCDFFINNYPDLTNLNSWDVVKGHKELPGQLSLCPGDEWILWKDKITSGVLVNQMSSGGIIFNSPAESNAKPDPKEKALILKSQVDSLQTTLASVNQQLIFLQEAVAEKDQQINQLKQAEKDGKVESNSVESVSITQALINLYNFIFPQRIDS